MSEEIRDLDVRHTPACRYSKGKQQMNSAGSRHFPGGHPNKSSRSYYKDLETTMYETIETIESPLGHSALDEETRFYQSCSSGGESLEDIRQKSANETATTQMSAEEHLACTTGRQVAIHQLLTCEEDFTRMMKRGAQRFSRPLRHQLLSRSQHATLFQNIEKVCQKNIFYKLTIKTTSKQYLSETCT